MATESTESSFDALARGLASGNLSRGKALRLDGGALLGAALASVPGVAWANDRCSQGQTRCGDRCVNLQTNERHYGSCRNRCGPNQTCCKGRCVNLKRNENHCGSCSNRCDDGERCVRGECQGGCPGTQICGDACCAADESCWSGPEIAICCSNDPFCAGVVTVAGQDVCADYAAYGDCNRPTCNMDAECSSGELCVPTFCDPGNRCVPAC